MRYLSVDVEIREVMEYFHEAANEADKSTCTSAKCGAVIANNRLIIGRGFNSPPRGLESQRRCIFNKENYDRKITDRTCCIHAEQRAILDALKNNKDKIVGSSLYFTRVGKDGDFINSGKPYCTLCSKMSLDVGISKFFLWHEEGICVYNTEEYNEISYSYRE